MLTVVPGDGSGHEGGTDGSPSLIDEIVREGARRMLAEALQAEVDAYIAAHAAERDENGRRLVVRNGCHQPREVLTSAGAIEVTVPRVTGKRADPDTGERKRFSSAIVPPWARKTPKITEVLPLLYLHGLSSGDFVPALGQFLGSSAGLSPAVITRLTETWRAEQRAFAARDLSGADYVYLRADGIHVNIRLEEHKLCLLVMLGVRADGRNGHTMADRAIQLATNSPVNHVGMSVAIEDLPPLMWHAELGRSLPDVWTGARHRGVQLHDNCVLQGVSAEARPPPQARSRPARITALPNLSARPDATRPVPYWRTPCPCRTPESPGSGRTASSGQACCRGASIPYRDPGDQILTATCQAVA